MAWKTGVLGMNWMGRFYFGIKICLLCKSSHWVPICVGWLCYIMPCLIRYCYANLPMLKPPCGQNIM